MPGINTSMGTSASMKSLLKTEREMLSAMERISSGKRINIVQAMMLLVQLLVIECLQQLEHSICQLETLMFYQWRKLLKVH